MLGCTLEQPFMSNERGVYKCSSLRLAAEDLLNHIAGYGKPETLSHLCVAGSKHQDLNFPCSA
ncbi:Hypothetical predicted protein [Paramuricea clavata]|nr:Hypothetical predicted protein [Paramuricea clavata]